MNATEWVAAHLRASPHTLAAVSAALWGLVGRAVTLDDLQWARRLLGDEAPLMLLNTLRATGVLECNPPVIRPQVLASLVAFWAAHPSHPVVAVTLPSWLGATLPEVPATRQVLTRVITSATRELLLCAPYIDREGVSLLVEPLREVTCRGVQVTLATHHLDDPQSPNARALTVLRTEVQTLRGLHLPSIIRSPEGSDVPLLVHAKLVIADDHTALIGSANLTKAGLTGNVEVGTVVYGFAAVQARLLWTAILTGSGVHF